MISRRAVFAGGRKGSVRRDMVIAAYGGDPPVNAPSDQSFPQRIDALRRALVEQGKRVEGAIETVVEAVFERDAAKARSVIAMDETIDRVDVQIEKDAVALLTDAARRGCSMDENQVRMVLTIVKVNNEFERIGDLAADIAHRVETLIALKTPVPPKFRVMANSVIGIMHQANKALANMDASAAQVLLKSDDATEAFNRAVLRDVEEDLVKGKHSVDFAFALNTIAAALARMADHCTNVAEQVIYVESGMIVRHLGDTWTAPQAPGV